MHLHETLGLMKHSDFIDTHRTCQYPNCEAVAVYERVATWAEGTATRFRRVIVMGSLCDIHKAELPDLKISFYRCGGIVYIEEVTAE